ncbi:MAG: oligosaccharide flippase family protein [Candidatus Hydrogenedentota bacterium]
MSIPTTSYRTLKHTLAYGVGLVFQRGTNYLLLPLLTTLLSPADYGYYALCFSVTAILVPLFEFAMLTALARFYFDVEADERPHVAFTVLAYLLAHTVVLTAILTLGAWFIGPIISEGPQTRRLLVLAAASACLSTLNNVPLIVLRVQERSSVYALLGAVRGALNLVLVFVFVAVVEFGWEGAIGGDILASCLAAGIGAVAVRKALKGEMRFPILSRMIKFALPIVPMNLAAAAFLSIDPLFIKTLGSMEEVATYAVALRVALILNLVVAAFQTAWPVTLFQMAEFEDAPARIARSTRHALAAMSIVCSALMLLVPELVGILAPSDVYRVSSEAAPLILLGLWVNAGVYMVMSNLHIPKKTGYLPLIYGSGLAVKVALNFAWIPDYGIVGAASATLVGYLAQCAVAIWISRSFYPVPYEVGKLAWLLAATALVCGAARFSYDLSYAPSVLARLGALVLFMASLMITGTVGWSEIRALRGRR